MRKEPGPAASVESGGGLLSGKVAGWVGGREREARGGVLAELCRLSPCRRWI